VSPLPWPQGFELVPVTLEVGDYVLSPDLVVERKALPDLHASLASGRCGQRGHSLLQMSGSGRCAAGGAGGRAAAAGRQCA
jgi:hypothetical protein